MRKNNLNYREEVKSGQYSSARRLGGRLANKRFKFQPKKKFR